MMEKTVTFNKFVTNKRFIILNIIGTYFGMIKQIVKNSQDIIQIRPRAFESTTRIL